MPFKPISFVLNDWIESFRIKINSCTDISCIERLLKEYLIEKIVIKSKIEFIGKKTTTHQNNSQFNPISKYWIFDYRINFSGSDNILECSISGINLDTEGKVGNQKIEIRHNHINISRGIEYTEDVVSLTTKLEQIEQMNQAFLKNLQSHIEQENIRLNNYNNAIKKLSNSRTKDINGLENVFEKYNKN